MFELTPGQAAFIIFCNCYAAKLYMTLLVPKVILLESFLSFLGLGVQEPLTSLGVLISEGARNMRGAAYMLLYPSLALTALLFALNFLGDGLRDALDPKDR